MVVIMATVFGLDDLSRRLDALPDALRSEVDREISDGAERIASLARSLASTGTGAERSSIRVERDGGGVRVAAGGPSTTKDGVDHAVIAEFGAAHHPAHPFMNPAVTALAPSIIGRIAKAVTAAARKVGLA